MSDHDRTPTFLASRAEVVPECSSVSTLREDEFLQKLDKLDGSDGADIKTELKSLMQKVPYKFWSKGLLRVAAANTNACAFFMNYVELENEVMQELLYNSRDDFGYTILHKAVDSKNPELAKLLTDGCVSFSEKCPRFTTNTEQSKWVLNFIHARTIKGSTALHFASLLGDANTVDQLVSLYDKFVIPANKVSSFLDKAWMTPLHYAVLQKNASIVTTLLGCKAYTRHLNVGDWSMRTPLHVACSVPEGPFTDESALRVITELLRSPNVDVNALDCCRFTPLHWAVYVRSTGVVKEILSKATATNIRSTEEDCEGRTVLQHALTKKSDPQESFIRDKYSLDNSNDEFQRRGKDVGRLLMQFPGVKDEVEALYRDRQVYVDAANAMLVGAALIAGVTFQGLLQPPLGNSQQRSRRIDRIFWVFNSLSFFFAIASVLGGAGAVLPMANAYIGDAVARVRDWLAVTAFLLLISVTCVLGSFATAGFAAGTAVADVDPHMTVTTGVGSLVCGLLGVFFLRGLFHAPPGWVQVLMWKHKLRAFWTGIVSTLGCGWTKACQSRSRTSSHQQQYELRRVQALDRTFRLLTQNGRNLDDKNNQLQQHVVSALDIAHANLEKQRKHEDDPLQMLQFVIDLCPYGLRKTKHRKLREDDVQTAYKGEEEWDELVTEMVTKGSGRGLLHMLVHLPTKSCRDICLRNNTLDFLEILRDRVNSERSCVYTVSVAGPGPPFVQCESCAQLSSSNPR